MCPIGCRIYLCGHEDRVVLKYCRDSTSQGWLFKSRAICANPQLVPLPGDSSGNLCPECQQTNLRQQKAFNRRARSEKVKELKRNIRPLLHTAQGTVIGGAGSFTAPPTPRPVHDPSELKRSNAHRRAVRDDQNRHVPPRREQQEHHPRLRGEGKMASTSLRTQDMYYPSISTASTLDRTQTKQREERQLTAQRDIRIRCDPTINSSRRVASDEGKQHPSRIHEQGAGSPHRYQESSRRTRAESADRPPIQNSRDSRRDKDRYGTRRAIASDGAQFDLGYRPNPMFANRSALSRSATVNSPWTTPIQDRRRRYGADQVHRGRTLDRRI